MSACARAAKHESCPARRLSAIRFGRIEDVASRTPRAITLGDELAPLGRRGEGHLLAVAPADLAAAVEVDAPGEGDHGVAPNDVPKKALR